MPIRDGKDALTVSLQEITTTKAKRTVIYQNSFVTPHLITYASIIEIVMDGRSRWKTVHCNHNINHNILKTKGYHIEHNFGHGDKHLASLFVTFNLRA